MTKNLENDQCISKKKKPMKKKHVENVKCELAEVAQEQKVQPCTPAEHSPHIWGTSKQTSPVPPHPFATSIPYLHHPGLGEHLFLLACPFSEWALQGKAVQILNYFYQHQIAECFCYSQQCPLSLSCSQNQLQPPAKALLDLTWSSSTPSRKLFIFRHLNKMLTLLFFHNSMTHISLVSHCVFPALVSHRVLVQ